jgi:hypothetical protein
VPLSCREAGAGRVRPDGLPGAPISPSVAIDGQAPSTEPATRVGPVNPCQGCSDNPGSPCPQAKQDARTGRCRGRRRGDDAPLTQRSHGYRAYASGRVTCGNRIVVEDQFGAQDESLLVLPAGTGHRSMSRSGSTSPFRTPVTAPVRWVTDVTSNSTITAGSTPTGRQRRRPRVPSRVPVRGECRWD